MGSSNDNTFYGSGRVVEKISLQTKKAAEGIDGDLTCHAFSLDDAVAHCAKSNPTEDLSIQK